MSETPLFAFVQLEFGFLLGPPDGRYVVREVAGSEPEAVLVLGTLGAPQRRLLGRRRARAGSDDGSPEPVPTNRVTIVRAQPFESEAAAEAWLADTRRDEEAATAELEVAMRHLNRALHAHRIAHGDPRVRDVAPAMALVVRIGLGAGEEVAGGRYRDAWRLPAADRRSRLRSMDTPDDRFAALLGATDQPLACEELVMRARADVDAGREREAALQARVALEAVLAELRPTLSPTRTAALEEDRALIGEGANAALKGSPSTVQAAAVAACVTRMEEALRAHRLATRNH